VERFIYMRILIFFISLTLYLKIMINTLKVFSIFFYIYY